MEKNVSALVVDNGSGWCKAGLATDEAPRAVFPTVVGTPAQQTEGANRDCFIGEEAQSRRETLSLVHPIQRGVVSKWEDMERVWQYAFSQQLRVDARDYPVLMTEAPLTARPDREKITQVMFETFNTPMFYVVNPQVLAMYTTGKLDGVVVDCGEGVTHVVPISQGYALPNAIERREMAGGDLTAFFQQMMSDSGIDLPTSDANVMRDMKEKVCQVANNASAGGPDTTYTLPDGRVVTIGNQRFRASEMFFTPSVAGREGEGLPQLVHQSIQKCDSGLRQALYGNVVLSGGTTMLAGFEERLTRELTVLARDQGRVKVVAPSGCQTMAWVGGSILASVTDFQSMWISKREYEEEGAAVVHRKCSLGKP